MEKRNKNKKIILGIDPGSTKIGYGVISYTNKELKPKAIGYGYIDLRNYNVQAKRLLQLHKDIKNLLDQYKPDSIIIESIYFFKNSKTFIPVVQSRGIILLTAAQAKIDIYEYSPLQIKQTITGYGRANKKFVQKLVQTSLDISSNIKPDDASDALAVALCHLRNLT